MKPPIWFTVGLIAASVTAATATPQNASQGLSPAEKWVVAQATAGEVADLDGALNADQTKKFQEENDRRLSAHFLEDLLTVALPGFKPHRKGVRIKGAIIDEPIDLGNAQIPCEVRLENCQFVSSAFFMHASFAGDVSFDDSTFKARSDFIAMKVGGAASFENAVFEGPVDFAYSNITTNFDAKGAQFKNKELGATFGSMKVGGAAFFQKAVFEGPADFIAADIASNFEAIEAQFRSKVKEANFNSMSVGHTADFDKAVFEGPADFVTADIAGNFQAIAVQFKSKEQQANFNGMKVGHTAFFRTAVFEGPVEFASANVGSNFEADEAQFKSKEQLANFDDIRVGGTAFLRKAVFEGPVNFGTADIAGDFEASEAQFKNKEKDAQFSSMKVRGSAFFQDAVFAGPVNFNYAEFAWLDLSSPFWPKIAGQLRLSGMSYKYVRAVPRNEPESHKALLKLADQSAYTADVYTNLEEFLKRQGYPADADRAFIAGKHRERAERLHGLGWVGSVLLDWLVGYGRHPRQAGIPLVLLVTLGCILFSPAKMELQDPKELEKSKEMRHQYNRFWYSLGLLLPVVDLKSSELWKPMKKHPFLRNYVRVHILLGWILIPIVLAALAGLIK